MPENVNIDLFIDEDDLLPMSALEYDEEVKLEPKETIAKRVTLSPQNENEGTGLKVLTPNKLVTRLPTLLAQIKLEAIQTNEKMELVKYCIFCTSIITPPKKCRTI